MRRGGVRLSVPARPSPYLAALGRSEPEVLLVELFGEVAALKQTVVGQREAIARLNDLKGRVSYAISNGIRLVSR